MRQKSPLRERLEKLEPGGEIRLEGARIGTARYMQASSIIQRLQSANAGSFSLRSTKAGVVITRARYEIAKGE